VRIFYFIFFKGETVSHEITTKLQFDETGLQFDYTGVFVDAKVS
jgi:hypothetical protein